MPAKRILVRVRVLVVEDHATLAGRIAQGLRQVGIAADVVHDGAAALDATAQTAYDVSCSTVTAVVHGIGLQTVAGRPRTSCSRPPPMSRTGSTG
jgi:CheY-like chemotaxis protein